MLVELHWEAVWACRLVMFHTENGIPNLLLCEWSRDEFIFSRTYLGDVFSPITQEKNIILLRKTEELFIELCDITFKVLLPLNFSSFMFQRKDTLFAMLDVGNHLEVSSIVVSQKDINGFGPLIEFELLFSKELN